jgi:hypothetical protein
MGDKKTERELDKEALVQIFTKDSEYCQDLLRETFLQNTPQADLMQDRLLGGILRTARLDQAALRLNDHYSLERVFTGDREYCMDLMRKLFVGEDERAKLMTHRLLGAVFECRPELPHVESMSRMEKMRYYMEKIEWDTETCRLYAEGAKHIGSVMERPKYRMWQEMDDALAHAMMADGEDDRPVLSGCVFQELRDILHIEAHSKPWWAENLDERRSNYRAHKRRRAQRERGCIGLPCVCKLCACVLCACVFWLTRCP